MKLNMTALMLEWNLSEAVSSLSPVMSQQEQDSVMEAVTAAIETEHRVEQAFRARRHRTKFVRSTSESERIGHNFRMARTLQEAVHNGKLRHQARSNEKLSPFSYWRPGIH